MPPSLPPTPTPALTLDTPVVLPAGWPSSAGGDGASGPGPTGAPPRRVLLRDLLAQLEPGVDRHGPRLKVVDIAAALVDVPPGEVLGDDSPTTGAVNAVARQLAALRRRGRVAGAP